MADQQPQTPSIPYDPQEDERLRLASLYGKLAAIAAELTHIQEDAYNEQLRYHYASPESVMRMVKPLLVKHRLAVLPQIIGVEKIDTGTATKSGQPNVITRDELAIIIADGDTGASITLSWYGEGQDWSDKGIAKAATVGIRTFLMWLFQIPSGDLPDPDEGVRTQSNSHSQHSSSSKPQAATQAIHAPYMPYSQSGAALGADDDFDHVPASSASRSGPTASEKQVKAIFAIGKARKRLTSDAIEDLAQERYSASTGALTVSQASDFIQYLQGEEG